MSEIRQFSIFNALSEESQRLLEHGAVTIQLPERKSVIKRGQQVSGAYFVLNGRLRVFTSLVNGKEATL